MKLTKEVSKELDRLCGLYLKAKQVAYYKDNLSKQIKGIVNETCELVTEKYFINITERKGRYKVDENLLKERYPEIYNEVCTKWSPSSLILSKVDELKGIKL